MRHTLYVVNKKIQDAECDGYTSQRPRGTNSALDYIDASWRNPLDCEKVLLSFTIQTSRACHSRVPGLK